MIVMKFGGSSVESGGAIRRVAAIVKDHVSRNPVVVVSAMGKDSRETENPLEVVVLHTTTRGTLSSLKTAATLAAGLAAHIRLLVLEVVPYPLPVESPRVPLEFTQRRFSTVAETARIETRVEILLGRDESRMIESALNPHSLVVLEGPGKWWPTRRGRLARRLKRLGHHVVFAT